MKKKIPTIYEKVKEYLEEEPKARERRLHKRGMVNLLLRKAKFQDIVSTFINEHEGAKDELIEFCSEFESATRAWRKVTEENPQLQGSDYSDKDELEVQKQEELGYNMGYKDN